VSSGGTEIVASGGGDAGARISGGTEIISSGGVATGDTIFAGSQVVSSGGTASSTIVSGGGLFVLAGGVADPVVISSGGSETVSVGGTDDGALISGGTQFVYGLASGAAVFTGSQVVESGGTASGTTVGSGSKEIVLSGGTALGTALSSGSEIDIYGSVSGFVVSAGITLVVGAGGTATTVLSGGSETVASGGSDVGTQKTTGANASGTLIVKEGSQTQSFTLVGSYTSANFSVTSDRHGGTLITDPPVTSGGSVATNAEITFGGEGFTSFVSGVIKVAEKIEDAVWNPGGGGTVDPPNLSLQWLQNFAASVVSDLEGLASTGGFEQLLNEIEGRCSSSGSGSTASDQFSPSGHSISGFAAGWQSHMVETLASFGDGKGGPPQESPFQSSDQAMQGYLTVPHQS
jgi:autotransporter passenger strand-loop-strand repeat protein